MTKHDTYIHQQLAPRLQPGEAIACTGFLVERALAWASIGMIGMIGRGYHFTALTDRRLFLIATQLGLSGVKLLNEGVVEIPLDDLAEVQVQGPALVRTVIITQRSGATRTLRYSRVFKVSATEERFLDLLARLPEHGAASAAGAPAPAMAASGTGAREGAAASGAMTVVEQLRQLAALHRSGVLTDDEYGVTRAELVKRL